MCGRVGLRVLDAGLKVLLESAARPHTRNRVQGGIDAGLPQRGEVELFLGRYVEKTVPDSLEPRLISGHVFDATARAQEGAALGKTMRVTFYGVNLSDGVTIRYLDMVRVALGNPLSFEDRVHELSQTAPLARKL